MKFFNTTKGFGFIARDDGQADAFVHISAVQRAGMTGLDEGDRVEAGTVLADGPTTETN